MAISKYLQQYRQNEAQVLQTSFKQYRPNCFDYAVIIPAFNEPHHWFEQLSQCVQQHSIIWIIVLNRPEHTCSKALEHAKAQQNYFRTLGLNTTHNTLFDWIKLSELQSLLLINRFERPIISKQGVGLARKIGNDIALTLYHHGFIRTPWLFNTDADALLPNNYFEPFVNQHNNKPTNISAYVYHFKHTAKTKALQEATWCYDTYLRYYTAGLQYARSPYAYPTIGSLLALSAKHYAQVRGYPKRAAGEDFYILNKLRKLAPIQTLNNPTITLAGRLSKRVPFGTGPALEKIKNQNRKAFMVYAPSSFQYLKELLYNVHQQIEQQKNDFNIAKTYHNHLHALGFNTWLSKVNWPKQAAQQKHKLWHNWFDALKTLQLIRHLQHHSHPAQPIQYALEQTQHWSKY